MGNLFSILSWIIVGVLCAGVVGLLAGTHLRQHWKENLLVGTLGAFLGGFPFALLTGRQAAFEWNTGSLVLELIGALVLLLVLQWGRRA